MPGPHIVTIEHTSDALRGNPLGDPHTRTLHVYLPPGYDDAPSQRYPVIWVLAPFTSWGARLFNLEAWDENIVQRMDRLVDSGAARPAILAFPDAFTRYGGSQYVNSSAIGRYEDYVVDELVPLVDAAFRTVEGSAHRGVMGHSSGGYAALMLAMRHPDVFGGAASHSGDMAFEFCYGPDIPGAVRAFDSAGGVEAFVDSLTAIERPRERSADWFSALNLCAMAAAYSPDPASPTGFVLPFDPHSGAIRKDVWAQWLKHDPLRAAPEHADALRSLRALYFDCGTRDEYNLFLGARQLDAALDELDVAHTYEEFDGRHSGINWRFDVSLPILTQALSVE